MSDKDTKVTAVDSAVAADEAKIVREDEGSEKSVQCACGCGETFVPEKPGYRFRPECIAVEGRTECIFGDCHNSVKPGQRYCDDCYEKRVKGRCGDCGKPCNPKHQLCGDCHRDSQGWTGGKGSERRGNKRDRKGSRRGWMPSQADVEEHMEKVLAIVKGIKSRNTDRRDNTLRYDFSAADELFEKAKARYAEGKFGRVELDDASYKNILDFLYQGVLATANTLVAEGKLGDVTRIVVESGLDWNAEVAKRGDGSAVTLADAHAAVGEMVEKDAEQAAADAHEVLIFTFRLRDAADEAAGAASRADFLRNLGADDNFVEAVESRGGRRGGGRRRGGSKGESGNRRDRLEPYKRPRKGGRDGGTTIGDYVTGGD